MPKQSRGMLLMDTGRKVKIMKLIRSEMALVKWTASTLLGKKLCIKDDAEEDRG